MRGDKIYIERVRARNFRRIPSQLELQTARPKVPVPFILLTGSNSSGKTSVIQAIEWALFGKIGGIRSPDERAAQYVINDFADGEAEVAVSFRTPVGEVVVERQKGPGRGDTLVVHENGRAFKDEEAENRLTRLLGRLTHDDFGRFVYIRQDAVRALVLADPPDIDEAMDRLLGLEKPSRILEALPLREIKTLALKIQHKEEKLLGDIRGQAKEIETNLLKYGEKAKELNIEDAELSLDAAKNGIFRRLRQIISMLEGRGFPSPKLTETEIPSEIASRVAKFKRHVRSLKPKSTGASEAFQREYQTIAVALSAESIKKQESARLIEAIKPFRTHQELRKALKEAEERVETKEREMERLGALQLLLTNAEKVMTEAKPGFCPVCGQVHDLEKTISHIKAELSRLGPEPARIARELKDSQDVRNHLKKQEAFVASQAGIVEIKERDVKKALSELWDVYPPSKESARWYELVSKRAEELKTEFEREQRELQEFTEFQQELNTLIDQADVLADWLAEKKKELDIAAHLDLERKRIAPIYEAQNELLELKSYLEFINEAIVTVSGRLAVGLVETSRSEARRIYHHLSKHKAYPSLDIQVQEKRHAGRTKHTYRIEVVNEKRGLRRAASSRLNTADLNCLAMAIFFGLRDKLNHPLGFLVMDDPSQSLDEDHKGALVEVLEEISKDRQIIFATPDRDLARQIQRSPALKPKLVVCEFKSWSPESVDVSTIVT